jgi:hypothetical protein
MQEDQTLCQKTNVRAKQQPPSIDKQEAREAQATSQDKVGNVVAMCNNANTVQCRSGIM